LEIFCASEGGDVAGFGADVVGDGGFEPGEEEMGSWIVFVSELGKLELFAGM